MWLMQNAGASIKLGMPPLSLSEVLIKKDKKALYALVPALAIWYAVG